VWRREGWTGHVAAVLFACAPVIDSEDVERSNLVGLIMMILLIIFSCVTRAVSGP
jgi:hypothetical protein